MVDTEDMDEMAAGVVAQVRDAEEFTVSGSSRRGSGQRGRDGGTTVVDYALPTRKPPWRSSNAPGGAMTSLHQ
jgi:hypothetical protein